jgi:hypothetical protein
MRYAGWNLKANEAKQKAPIRFSLRRRRQYKFLKSLKLDVLMAVEVGSPEDAQAFNAGLAKVGSPLRVVKVAGRYAGKWRYIVANKDTTVVKHAGIRTLKHRYKDDAKQAAWAVIHVEGHDRLFVSGHLAVNGPTSNKVNQAHDVIALINEIKSRYGIPLRYCYVYLDTNDPTKHVANYLNSTGLSSTVKTTPLKGRIGTKIRSNNKWLRAVFGFSIDFLGASDDERHLRSKTYDCRLMSDHDLLLAITR